MPRIRTPASTNESIVNQADSRRVLAQATKALLSIMPTPRIAIMWVLAETTSASGRPKRSLHMAVIAANSA